jgi:hypothetical protein
MQLGRRCAVALLVAAAAPSLSACAKATHDVATSAPPARVEKIQGSDLNRLVLTKKAVERLGIETAPVGLAPSAAGGVQHTVVEYSALIYDAQGAAAVYTNPGPLVYVRAPVTVDHIDGGRAVLSAGPPPGTLVVTVGAVELYGVDTGVGGNE